MAPVPPPSPLLIAPFSTNDQSFWTKFFKTNVKRLPLALLPAPVSMNVNQKMTIVATSQVVADAIKNHLATTEERYDEEAINIVIIDAPIDADDAYIATLSNNTLSLSCTALAPSSGEVDVIQYTVIPNREGLWDLAILPTPTMTMPPPPEAIGIGIELTRACVGVALLGNLSDMDPALNWICQIESSGVRWFDILPSRMIMRSEDPAFAISSTMAIGGDTVVQTLQSLSSLTSLALPLEFRRLSPKAGLSIVACSDMKSLDLRVVVYNDGDAQTGPVILADNAYQIAESFYLPTSFYKTQGGLRLSGDDWVLANSHSLESLSVIGFKGLYMDIYAIKSGSFSEYVPPVG